MKKKQNRLYIRREDFERIYYDDWQPDRLLRVNATWRETPDEVKEYLRTSATVLNNGDKIELRFADAHDGPPATSRIRKQQCVWARKNKGPWFNTNSISLQEEIDKALNAPSADFYLESLGKPDVFAVTGELVEPASKEVREELLKDGVFVSRLYTDGEGKFFQQCHSCMKVFPYSRKYFRALDGVAHHKYPVLRPTCKDCKCVHEKAREMVTEYARTTAIMDIQKVEGSFYILFRRSGEDYIFIDIFAKEKGARKRREAIMKEKGYESWIHDKVKCRELYPIQCYVFKKSKMPFFEKEI